MRSERKICQGSRQFIDTIISGRCFKNAPINPGRKIFIGFLRAIAPKKEKPGK
jgi:hypothetical protein